MQIVRQRFPGFFMKKAGKIAPVHACGLRDAGKGERLVFMN